MNKFLKKIVDVIKYPWFYFIMELYCFLAPIYKRFIIPRIVKRVRAKDKIKVLFVIYELGSWKTENLYLMMLNHARFSPKLLLVPNVMADYAYSIFEKYLKGKGYEYETMNEGETIQKKLSPDIIFYQKPYVGVTAKEYSFIYNLNSLICELGYCFRNRCIPNKRISPYKSFAWQSYLENNSVKQDLLRIPSHKGVNYLVTGIPVMDVLVRNKSFFDNPWRTLPNKRRIIFAPHHTVYKSTSPFDYSTFLQYAEFMLEMAEKYKDKIQWAFKPHPMLQAKLNKIWGVDKTTTYYNRWRDMENTQLFEGEYMGLFKYSDAMIHDCGSFKLEYLYTGNPVMYLIKEDQEFDFPNWQTQEALKLHYHGHNKEEIEAFIINVMNGVDPLKEQRDKFVVDYLLPPNGKTACENIIESILEN